MDALYAMMGAALGGAIGSTVVLLWYLKRVEPTDDKPKGILPFTKRKARIIRNPDEAIKPS